MPPLPASIHTFGFGYGLRSGLLKSLAEYGNGNYAFIPDAGMLATVFVHAVANLQSTYATNSTLTLSYPSSLQLEEVSENSVTKESPATDPSCNMTTLRVSLGNLQFGQSRDLFFRVSSASGGLMVSAQLECSPKLGPTAAQLKIISEHAFSDQSGVSEAEAAYTESRALLTHVLSSMFELGPDLEHRGQFQTETALQQTVAKLIKDIPAKKYNDEANQSLMKDLNGPQPQGQVSIATSKADYWRRWGVHYLPSYYGAHARQICNSFKDPGPLRYGVDSPLFIQCRDRLSEAFDDLPAPEPSRPSPPAYSAGRSAQSPAQVRAPIQMSVYQQARGVCFAGSTSVELASGRAVPIRRLRRGVKVRTPTGTRKVAMVLRTAVADEPLCRVGDDLLVTPWHPICLDDSKTWTFPALAATSAVRYTGSVYSVLLQRDHNAQSHAIRVAGCSWGVTLGHGLTTGMDARAHHFFGDYNRVGKSLVQMGLDKFGVVEGRGVARDAASGLVCGFVPARAHADGSRLQVPSHRAVVARMAHTGGYSP